MPSRLCLLAFLLTLPMAAAAAEPALAKAAPPADPTDAALAEMRAVWQTPPPSGHEVTKRTLREFNDRKHRDYARLARALFARHPNDPRTYNGIVQSSYTPPYFLKGFRPEFDEKPGDANLIIDEPAKAAFLREQALLLERVILAPNAEVRQRGGGFYALMVDAGVLARLEGRTFDPTSVRPLVNRVLAALPDERAMPVVETYASQLRAKSPEAATAFLAEAGKSPVIAAAIKASEEKRQVAAAAKLDLASGLARLTFTAADGRAVEVAKLRGKVVLIDFWATWCGPCIAELPNVLANYRRYHERGFEVIGITLENALLKPDDTPEHAAAKRDTARTKMLGFAEKQGMPWPQYFDGKFWQNDLAKAYQVSSIPAMFLLDQEGRVVSTEARGEKLETEIRRLLKL